MKISLWQQFSSNHSARFTIVGNFDSATKADSVAAELRHILKVIDNWYKLHPELEEKWSSGDIPAPTEPEVQFSKQYDVDWGEFSIPWFHQVKISTVNNLVFVDSDGQADAGAWPFHAVMAKLGGSVGVDGDIWWNDLEKNVEFEINAKAPDEHTAKKVFSEIESFFTAPGENLWANPRTASFIAPWELYGTRYRGGFVPNILHVLPQDKTHGLDIYTPDFVKALIPLLKADTIDDELIERFAENVSRLADQGLDIFIQPDQIKDHLDEIIRSSLFFSHHDGWGTITRQGLQIQLSDLRFSRMAEGFPALMRYLADNGCTNIQYTFKETDRGEE